MLRTIRRRLGRMPLIALALLTGAALIAGCGDGRLGKNDYVKKTNAANQKILDATGKLSSAQSDPSKAGEQILKLKREVDGAIADIEKLKPPKDWQKYHDDMVNGMKDVSGAMDDLAKAADKKDAKLLASASTTMSTGAAAVDKAIAQMNANR